MSNTVFYIVVSIVIIHFGIGVVFLVRKLSEPLPEENSTQEGDAGVTKTTGDRGNKSIIT